jgi:hypothetical protein
MHLQWLSAANILSSYQIYWLAVLALCGMLLVA